MQNPTAQTNSAAQSPNAPEGATRTAESVSRYGALNIVIQGLPAAVAANLRLSGPNGWGMTVFRAGVLPNLAPGTYVVAPQSVSYGSYTYAPTTPMLTTNVLANSTATATITYAYTPPKPSTFSTQMMMALAQSMAANVTRYGQNLATGTTYCNVFVREFVSSLVGFSLPELSGVVRDQLAAISTSPHWREITNPSNWNATYADAASRAKAGHIVLAVTTAQDAHIAVVMPYDPMTGFTTLNGGRGYQVPRIAEATIRNRSTTCAAYGKNGLDSAAPLSCGFYTTQQPYIRFFVYTP
jgi:hypothetical protein